MVVKINRVDTGQVYDCNISPQATIETLREAAAHLTGVPAGEQILLSEGTQLSSTRTIESYISQKGDGDKDFDVFLFPRRLVDPSSPLPDDYKLPNSEVIFPQPRPLVRTREMDQSPLVEALKKYEHQFQYHLDTAQAIYDGTSRRAIACRACVDEERVQARGIDVALANLNDHLKQLLTAHTTFTNYFQQQRAIHDDLLQNFERDVAALHNIPLHSALRTPQCNTLGDCIPEPRLRLWAQECRVEHEQLRVKVANPAMQAAMAEIQNAVTVEVTRALDVDLRSQLDRLKSLSDATLEVRTRLEMFEGDYVRVQRTVQEALAQMGRQPVWGLADGLEEIRQVHETNIAAMLAQDKTLKAASAVFTGGKTTLTKSVYQRLRAVSQLQSQIRDQQNKIVLLSEALNKQRAAFSQLAYIRQMPQAYNAALTEVSRRKGYGKWLQKQLLSFTASLGQAREDEATRRNAFQQTYSRFVPKGLISGLDDPLPILDFTLPVFDVRLPSGIESSGDEDDFTVLGVPKDEPLAASLPPQFTTTNRGMLDSGLPMDSPDMSASHVDKLRSLELKLANTLIKDAANEDAVKKLERDLKDMQHTSMASAVRSQQLQETSDDLTRRLRDQSAELSQLKEQLVQSDAEHKQREHVQAQQGQVEVNLLKEKLALAKQIHEGCSEHSEKQDRSIKNKEKEIEDLTARNNAMLTLIEKKDTEAAEHIAKYEVVERKHADEIAAEHSAKKMLQEEVDGLKGEVGRLKAHLADEESRAEEKVSKMGAQSGEFQSEINKLQDRIGTMTAEHDHVLRSRDEIQKALEDELVVVKQRTTFLEERLQASKQGQSVIPQLEANIEDLKQRHAATTQQLEKADSEARDFAARLADLGRKYQDAQQQIQSLTSELNSSRADSSEVQQAGIEYLKLRNGLADIADLLRKADPLSPQHPGDAEDVQKVYTRVSRLVEHLTTIQRECSAERAKMVEVGNKYADTLSNLRISELALEERNIEIVSMRQAIDDLKGKIMAMELTHEEQRRAGEGSNSPHPPVSHARLDPRGKVALGNFEYGDLMLFMKNQDGHFEAVNVGSSHYFISQYTNDTAPLRLAGQEGLVLGVAIEISEERSNNNYNLPPGTIFHEVTLEKYHP
eukprot:TRINITY_DN2388_c0_g1_i1.p1 TRINITY_DN2388_c0_g1~~TRINITY_DN2388_c0_g1_i1.p1  ORF type:complete len:1128 (+),score=309.29 TRINITY_DN2388_c0_g1_i1:231-3614(+)